MNDIAVVVSNSIVGYSILDSIDAIKKAGYKNVFIQWYNKEEEYSQEEVLEYIRKKKLNILFAHLGYKYINDIWLDSDIGKTLVDYYINDLNTMKKYNINMVVMHLCSRTNAPIPNKLGLERIKKICEHAKKIGIKIAFENTKIQGYQEYIEDNINMDNVGYCYDCGHDHCHFNDKFNFEKFKDKIFCTHLHDNHGKEDEHLLPGDGTVDFDYVLNGLDKDNYDGPLTFEYVHTKTYENEDIDVFYKKGYNNSIKIYEKYKNKRSKNGRRSIKE